MPFKTDRPESKSLEKGEIKASIKGINTKVTSISKIQTFLNTKGNFLHIMEIPQTQRKKFSTYNISQHIT